MSGKRATKRSKYPTTVATWVCCNMISLTQTRYGERGCCHGKSWRPCASNQRSSRAANESLFTCRDSCVGERLGQQAADEFLGVEHAQVEDAFADTDEADRYADL